MSIMGKEFESLLNTKEQSLLDKIVENSDTMKTFILQSAAAASAHRENLQDIYNKKLDDIKDVCADYFSKYEAHLTTTQDQLNTM